jgi:exoribonuclease II
MNMGFGQKMKVPDFITTGSNGRLLADGIPMDQIDVTRDFVDLKFVLRSDVNPEDIKYNVYIEEWTEENFKLKVNFSDPF